MAHQHFETECTYCEIRMGGCVCSDVKSRVIRKETCGACTQKLKLLLGAMPHPATYCCAVAPGGQGWCRKPAQHQVPDADGKADSSHLVVVYGHFRIMWEDESKERAHP